METTRPPDVPHGWDKIGKEPVISHASTSPTDLLASFFSEDQPHRIYLVSGDRGAGKTVWCTRLARSAAQAGYKVAGLLSPGFFVAKDKLGINLLNLATNEIRTLSRTAAAHERAGRGEVRHLQNGCLVVGAWRMEASTLEWADRILTQLLTIPPTEKTILIIDELGPLEFNHAQGLIAPLLLPIDESYHATFIVVRPELLNKAYEHWPEALLIEIPSQAAQ